MSLEMTVVSLTGMDTLEIVPRRLVIAGWAQRDKEAMEHHIQELEALGVGRPAQTPTYYRVSVSRLSTRRSIEASGAASSGEVEPIVFSWEGKLYVGVGSDHTDREVEAYGITVSKQMCEKPIANVVWPFEEVAPHWDKLVIRSHISIDGQRVKYQEGSVDGLLHPLDTISGLDDGKLEDGTVLFCGTLPAIGGIKMSAIFHAEIEDPILNRTISLNYDIVTLPIAG